jgi:hypothetical protein
MFRDADADCVVTGPATMIARRLEHSQNASRWGHGRR